MRRATAVAILILLLVAGFPGKFVVAGHGGGEILRDLDRSTQGHGGGELL